MIFTKLRKGTHISIKYYQQSLKIRNIFNHDRILVIILPWAILGGVFVFFGVPIFEFGDLYFGEDLTFFLFLLQQQLLLEQDLLTYALDIAIIIDGGH